MPYCRECDCVTVQTDSSTCPVCGSVLIAIEDVPPEDRDRPVVLTQCDNLYEAMVLRTALEAEGIQTLVEDEGLLGVVGLMNPYHAGGTQGSTSVLVRLEDAEAALELLRRKEAGELTLSEDDLPEEPTEEPSN